MTVTQADRDAAADWLAEDGLDWGYCGDVRKGIHDHALAEAFTKHREDAERPLLERIEALEAENARLLEVRSAVSILPMRPGDENDQLNHAISMARLTFEGDKLVAVELIGDE